MANSYVLDLLSYTQFKNTVKQVTVLILTLIYH